MKKIIISIFILIVVMQVNAQSVHSIHFNLYTDSLKKGTHNYINIDGKMSDGSWRPLTAKEINFSTDYGEFEGNDLVLPDHTTVKKVTIKATLKHDNKTTREITIWIKQKPDPPLPTYDANAERRRRR